MAQIDWKEFNEYFQYFDKKTIKEVTDIYIDEYDVRIKNIQKNIEEKDYAKLKFNAHALKGISAHYQAPYVVELLQSLENMAIDKLENMANEKLEEQIPQTFEELKHASKELLDELIDYLKKR